MTQRRRGPRASCGLVALALLTVATGCGVEELIMDAFRGETPRERYLEALERSGLDRSTMVRSWQEAGERALRSSVEVASPMVEEIWFPPGEPMALGYLIDVERGQRIEVDVQPEDLTHALFVELFRIRADRDELDPDDPEVEDRSLLVSWADEDETRISYDARTSARYLLRVQPELLAGGAVQVAIRVGPSLAFPVEDSSTRAVGSFFGDIRDGGARDHHGVDIFAPRGTPVLAATEGTAYRVGVNNLGGNVVWVRDSTGDIRQYYAHLDTQLVRQGQQVQPGDVIGLVGNTGNARTTSPHLHFGIYLRGSGPVDPLPFLHDPGGTPAELAVARDAFQETLRILGDRVSLRSAPSSGASVVAELSRHLPVRVLGGSGRWFRVRLPTGEEGYLAGDLLGSADGSLVQAELSRSTVVRAAPREDAPRVREAREGEVVSVHGWSGDWAWVADGNGMAGGWLPLALEE